MVVTVFSTSSTQLMALSEPVIGCYQQQQQSAQNKHKPTHIASLD